MNYYWRGMQRQLKPKQPSIIIVLDGWGIAPAWGGNAISSARTVTFDKIWKTFPSTTLLASGEAVGLPVNSPGNSEAGHLNIGAGRVVHQDISLIDKEIANGNFAKNPVLAESLEHAIKNNSNIHLIGLLSETGTHSHIKHLFALLEYFKKNKFSKVYIHLITDGRDSDPMDGIELASKVENEVNKIGVGRISSLVGRFFAMDRDNRFERLSGALNLLISGEGATFDNVREAFSNSYSKHITDEFLSPSIIANQMHHFIPVSDNDSVILFNFRPDRTKELTEAFLAPQMPNMPRRKVLKNLHFSTFAMYEENSLAHKIFKPESVSESISSVWSQQGFRQFHIAETEKYPHVTYFFNGGTEKALTGETRKLIPSPRNIKTYDQKPEMSAKGVCDNVVSAIKSRKFDSIVINFANADMVGHSGNLKATMKAAEFVDACLKTILDVAIPAKWNAFVLADHGNAEQMVNPRTGEPDTGHTTNPVPFIIVSGDPEIANLTLQGNGILGSVAPTVLDIEGIEKPAEMLNQSLIINEKKSV